MPSALIRRRTTGRTIAFAVWLVLGVPQVVWMTQAEYDDFAVTGQGRGEPVGKPDPTAVFVMAAGGVAELDTPNGHPALGDVWEEVDPDVGSYLVVALGSTPDYEYTFEQAVPPSGGRSRVAGIRVTSRGHRLVLFPAADYVGQDPATISLTPARRVALAGKVDITAGLLTVDAAYPRETKTDTSRTIPNSRSVTFDAAASANTGGTAASSLTFAHTVANQANRYISGGGASREGQDVSSITYAADALTVQLNSAAVARGVYADRVAPATGSNNAVFTWDAATSLVAGVWSAYGVDQTTPRSATGTNNGSNLTPTITIASAVGELVLSVLSSERAYTEDVTWTSDWTLLNTDANPRSGAGGHIAGAASVTRTGSLAGAGTPAWRMLAASIKEVATGVPHRLLLLGVGI